MNQSDPMNEPADDSVRGFHQIARDLWECNACGCATSRRERHLNVCHMIEHEVWTTEDFNEPAPLTVPPLSMLIADRDGMIFLVDGRTDDTQIDLGSLDPVSKAGLLVVLQQAIAELRPRATGGPITIQPGGPWNLGGITTSGVAPRLAGEAP